MATTDYVKALSDMYERFEEARTEAKRFQDEAKDLKKEMMEMIEDQGVDSVVISGLDSDAVKLSIEIVERETLNKKAIAESLGLKAKDLSKIADWVKLTNEGKITPQIIEDAKFTEEREQLKIENYDEEEEG